MSVCLTSLFTLVTHDSLVSRDHPSSPDSSPHTRLYYLTGPIFLKHPNFSTTSCGTHRCQWQKSPFFQYFSERPLLCVLPAAPVDILLLLDPSQVSEIFFPHSIYHNAWIWFPSLLPQKINSLKNMPLESRLHYLLVSQPSINLPLLTLILWGFKAPGFLCPSLAQLLSPILVTP